LNFKLLQRELKITQQEIHEATGAARWKIQLLRAQGVKAVSRWTSEERSALKAYLSLKVQVRMREFSEMHKEIMRL